MRGVGGLQLPPSLKEQIHEGQRTQPYDWQRSNVIRHASVCISSGKYFPFPASFAGERRHRWSVEVQRVSRPTVRDNTFPNFVIRPGVI